MDAILKAPKGWDYNPQSGKVAPGNGDKYPGFEFPTGFEEGALPKGGDILTFPEPRERGIMDPIPPPGKYRVDDCREYVMDKWGLTDHVIITVYPIRENNYR